jgi:hypothetical protein
MSTDYLTNSPVARNIESDSGAPVLSACRRDRAGTGFHFASRIANCESRSSVVTLLQKSTASSLLRLCLDYCQVLYATKPPNRVAFLLHFSHVN